VVGEKTMKIRLANPSLTWIMALACCNAVGCGLDDDEELPDDFRDINSAELKLQHADGSSVYAEPADPKTGDWIISYTPRPEGKLRDVISGPAEICEAGMAVSNVVFSRGFAIGAFVCRYSPIGAFEPTNSDYVVVAWNMERAYVVGKAIGHSIPRLTVDEGSATVVMNWEVLSDYTNSEGESERIIPVYSERRAIVFVPEGSDDFRLDVPREVGSLASPTQR
jgi:hypothetical protein